MTTPSPSATDARERERVRLGQCPNRRPGASHSCALVDVSLGWQHRMHIYDCDQCWERGPTSPAGEFWRMCYVDEVVESLVKHPPSQMQPLVTLTIAGRHLRGEAAKRYIMRAAPAVGEEAAIKLAAPHGAEFEAAVREKLAGMTPEQALDELAPSVRWSKVRGTWEKAQAFAKAIASRGILQDRHADDLIVAQRTVSCTGVTPRGEVLGEPCPSLQQTEKGLFCNDCGCGDKEIAELTGSKWTFPYLECPRRRPGFSNAIRPVAVKLSVTAKGRGAEPRAHPAGQRLIIENVCHGIGDAAVYAWVMHSARAAGVEAFLKVNRSHETFDIFGVPEEWRTEEPGNTREPPKAVPGVMGWLRSWLVGYGIGDVPYARPPLPVGHPGLADWAARMWDARDKATGTRGRRVLICPEVVWKPREWPAAYYSLLMRKLVERGYNPMAQMQGWDPGHIYEPYAFGGDTLRHMVAIMRGADLIIGNDSGPCHFAGTLDKPFLALCGPSPAEFFEHMPSVRRLDVGPTRMPCVSCNFEGGRGYHRRCDRGCSALMSLTPDAVLSAAMEMLP